MNRLCHILFLLINCIMLLSAQTPYDAYAPEMYRPMIRLESERDVRSWHEQVQADIALYVVVVDTENSMVMLYNHTCDSLLAAGKEQDIETRYICIWKSYHTCLHCQSSAK